ncbi:MAG: phosphotransferase family protein [Betaproteobacteria bacterium]
MPQGPDELTPALLTRALHDVLRSPGARVVGKGWERIGQEFGFTGLVARLHLTYQPVGAGPATVVAKFPFWDRDLSGYRRTQQARPEAARQYRLRAAREAWFYRRFGPDLIGVTPRCYAAADDIEHDRLVLLLEDVESAQTGDALHGCSPGQCEAVLMAIAPLHATAWNNPELLADLPTWSQDAAARDARQARFRQQWLALSAGAALDLPDRLLDLGEKLTGRLADVLARLDAGAHTLVHADLHLDNVLFTRSPHRPAVILDWQSVARGPAALDAIRIVTGSLTPVDRHSHEPSLLSGYKNALRARGVPEHDLDTFEEQCGLVLLTSFAGIIGWIASTRATELHGREQALRDAALGDGSLIAALLDHDVDALI